MLSKFTAIKAFVISLMMKTLNDNLEQCQVGLLMLEHTRVKTQITTLLPAIMSWLWKQTRV
jgi:hypothetical protein